MPGASCASRPRGRLDIQHGIERCLGAIAETRCGNAVDDRPRRMVHGVLSVRRDLDEFYGLGREFEVVIAPIALDGEDGEPDPEDGDDCNRTQCDESVGSQDQSHKPERADEEADNESADVFDRDAGPMTSRPYSSMASSRTASRSALSDPGGNFSSDSSMDLREPDESPLLTPPISTSWSQTTRE